MRSPPVLEFQMNSCTPRPNIDNEFHWNGRLSTLTFYASRDAYTMREDFSVQHNIPVIDQMAEINEQGSTNQ